MGQHGPSSLHLSRDYRTGLVTVVRDALSARNRQSLFGNRDLETESSNLGVQRRAMPSTDQAFGVCRAKYRNRRNPPFERE